MPEGIKYENISDGYITQDDIGRFIYRIARETRRDRRFDWIILEVTAWAQDKPNGNTNFETFKGSDRKSIKWEWMQREIENQIIGNSRTRLHLMKNVYQCVCCNPQCQNKGILKRCKHCKRVLYCSKHCQKRHWVVHKPLCTRY